MDRRTHPRFSVLFPVNFSVDLQGPQFLVEHFSSSGAVVDISRNGLLAEVDRLLSVGTQCSVSLVDPDGFVQPQQLRGKVRRSVISNAGWRVGIEFESLADLLPQIANANHDPEVRTASS